MNEALETETLEQELEDLINQLPITNSLSVPEFINIDENILYEEEEETTIKEIVDTVRGIGAEEEEFVEKKVSVREALECLTLLQSFIN